MNCSNTLNNIYIYNINISYPSYPIFKKYFTLSPLKSTFNCFSYFKWCISILSLQVDTVSLTSTSEQNSSNSSLQFLVISKMFHVCTFSAICSTGSSSRPLGKRGNQWLLFCSQFNNNVDERSAELPLSSAWNVIIQPRQTAFSAQGVFLAKICTVLSPLSTVHKMFRLSTEIYQMCTTVSWGGKTRLYSCYERKTYQKNDQKNCKLQMWLFPQYDATACPSFFYQGFIWC